MILFEELSETIIGAAMEVHRHTGPGLLESAYERFICHELMLRRIPFESQCPLPVTYKGMTLDCGYRMDLVVDDKVVVDKVVVEIKAVETVMDVHEAQLLTYLKLSKKRVGLLINFCVPLLR